MIAELLAAAAASRGASGRAPPLCVGWTEGGRTVLLSASTGCADPWAAALASPGGPRLLLATLGPDPSQREHLARRPGWTCGALWAHPEGYLTAQESLGEGHHREAAKRLLLGWRRVREGGWPEVTVKVASSLDGSLSTATGESQWITGPAARREGHRLRAEHDAILVGIGTVLADDPRLTCRHETYPGRHPLPVVLDSWGRLPPSAQVRRHPRGLLCFSALDAPLATALPEVVRVARTSAGLDLREVLAELGRRGVQRVLVEGGSQVIRSFFDLDAVDTLELFLAGQLIPGGKTWLGGAPLGRLGEALRLQLDACGPVGEDVHLRWVRGGDLQRPAR